MPAYAEVAVTSSPSLGVRRHGATFQSMPEEIITLIAISLKRNEKTRKRKYILQVADLSNLRLVNKRTSQYVQHAFGVRFFRCRKHMLSEFSLEGLCDIAQHSVFSAYVREVSLGPERIPASKDKIYPRISPRDLIPPLPIEEIDETTPLQPPQLPDSSVIFDSAEFESKLTQAIFDANKRAMEVHLHQRLELERLSQEQEKFETSGGAVRLLREALENFSKLEKVSLRSYPRSLVNSRGALNYIGYQWTPPWGLPHLAAELSSALCCPSKYCMDLEKTFSQNGCSKINWHIDPILQALYAIRDRPQWKLDFDLNSSEDFIEPIETTYFPGPAFDIETDLWKACEDRVQQISLHRTIITNPQTQFYARADWLIELFRSCGKNVEVLHCQFTTYWAKICAQITLPRLRHLHVCRSWFQDLYFRKFLIGHRETLETIKLEAVHLSIDEYARTNPPILVALSYNDASWIEKFDLMLKMPRLRYVELMTLSWTYKQPNLLSSCHVATGEGWSRSIRARGSSVATALREAIQNNAIEWKPNDEEGEGLARLQMPCVLFATGELSPLGSDD